MTIRIWDGNSIEQCTVGSLLPANSKPFSTNKSDLVPALLGKVFSFPLNPNEDFYLQTLVGQGPGSASYTVRVDYGSGAVEEAWVRSSTAEPTGKMDLGTGYIKVPAGALLSVEVCHWLDDGYDYNVTLGGGLVTGN